MTNNQTKYYVATYFIPKVHLLFLLMELILYTNRENIINAICNLYKKTLKKER